MKELFKLNVGDIVELNKKDLENSVEISDKELDSLIDDDSAMYQFINLGKVDFAGETMFMIFPIEGDWESTFYYCYHTEVYHTGTSSTEQIIECFKTRLMYALTCYLEHPDDYLDKEIEIARAALQTLKTVKELDEVSR